MQNRDFNKQIACATSIAPALHDATVTGTAIDIAQYGAVAIVVQVGTITDGTHTLSIEDSDNNSDFTAVSAGNLSGTVGALASDTVSEFGYLGTNRYVRAKVTVTGSPATGGTYGALVVRGGARVQPQ